MVGLVMMLAVPIRSWWAQRADLSELDREIRAAQGRLGELTQAKLRWNDPLFLEEEARRRMNVVRPGESGLIVLEPKERHHGELSADVGPQSWWERLWQSVDAASGRRAAEVDVDGAQVSPDAPR